MWESDFLAGCLESDSNPGPLDWQAVMLTADLTQPPYKFFINWKMINIYLLSNRLLVTMKSANLYVQKHKCKYMNILHK